MNQNYPEYILQRLKDRRDMDYEDKTRDDEFQNLSPREVLEELLEWEGICGYTARILTWIEDVYKIKLDQNYYHFSKENFVRGMANIVSAQYDNRPVAIRVDEDDEVYVLFQDSTVVSTKEM